MISPRSMVLSWVNPFFSLSESIYLACLYAVIYFILLSFLLKFHRNTICGWHTSWRHNWAITSWHTCQTFLLADVSTSPWVQMFPVLQIPLSWICPTYTVFVVFSQHTPVQHTPCEHDASFCSFMISSLKFLKRIPFSGFVNISAAIFPVGQYTTFTSFFKILWLMKKYLTLICLVCLLLDTLRFLQGV